MRQTRNELLRAAMKASAESHYELMFANFALKRVGYRDQGYVQRIDILNTATLYLSAAKWFFWRSTGEAADFARPTRCNEDLVRALELFDVANAYSRKAKMSDLEALRDAAEEARSVAQDNLSSDYEIQRFLGAPIVPSICPIVVLTGSSYDMGRQYLEQVLEIYGAFAFEGLSGRTFGPEEKDSLRLWRRELEAHAPEIVEMAHGMASAAIDHGLGLTYDHCQFMWTGATPPVENPTMIGVLDAEVCSITGYFGAEATDETAEIDNTPDLCSGFASWGEATAGEKTIVGCTTDHDCTFQATIFAYPDDGRAFVYTPFSVNGSIPGVGRFFFAGHPGVNEKGLCYVHHGGPCGCTEPQQDWGYGVRRGTTTLHSLRYADDRQAAETYEVSLPVGDNGYLLGSPGGFYADPQGAHVIESRVGLAAGSPPVIRRNTTDHDGRNLDFLYANNNVQSPDSQYLFCAPAQGYDYSVEGGWFLSDKSKMNMDDLGVLTRHMWAASSEPRNRYLHRILSAGYGDIDSGYAEAVYRRPAKLDTGDWRETEARLSAGEKLDGATGTRLNAQVSTLELRDGEPPVYRLSIGPVAHRSVPPHRAGYGFYYVDETNEMWELSLQPTPRETLEQACASARELVVNAEHLLRDEAGEDDGLRRLRALLETAESKLADAENLFEKSAAERLLSGHDAAHVARGLRFATQAQVRAKQVITALTHRPDLP
ncbi:MAG: hypothetical protein AAFR65_08520 [Pseudomonadota bacterium]